MGRKQKPKASEFKPRNLEARNTAQRDMILSVRDNDITFVFGPAGTGKTHVAAGLAVQYFQQEKIHRIILTRPLVSVGKDMGYLPGGIGEKVGPYVRPCFDELGYYLSHQHVVEMVNMQTLEIVPLSMMRGRTFRECFIILDEAQNATQNEMTSLLTRIGEGSKMVITGDPHQSDLPSGQQGAFQISANKLSDLPGIGIVKMSGSDIVRHSLIHEIIRRLGHG